MGKQDYEEHWAPIGPKEYWHPYSLQTLRPEKFVAVVNSIISGDRRLLPVARHPRRTPRTVYTPLFGK